MKSFISFLFFMSVMFAGITQDTIQFKCYLRNDCGVGVKELKSFELKKGKYVYYSQNQGSVATLPDTGVYILSSPDIAVDGDSLIVHIGSGLNIDTIKEIGIAEVVFVDVSAPKGMSQSGGWLCCGKVCNGYQADYYNDGKKRLEGTFKKGKPVGGLKGYDGNGNLKFIRYFDKKGKLVKSSSVNL